MAEMLSELLHKSYFALFVIVALGFMLGRMKIKGLSLDVSAVIFIALAFGHYGVVIPKELGTFGLVLFIFTIGIQAGPGFFQSFKSKGKALIIIAVLTIATAALTAIVCKYAFDIDTAKIVGLMAGALTSTPGLAAAIDSTGSADASIAYGFAYPFGVIGVILFVKLLPKMLKIDMQREAKRIEKEQKDAFPEVKRAIFCVSQPWVYGKSLIELKVRAVTGAVITRVRSGEDIQIPKADTVLLEGDYVQAVGTDEALNALSAMVGAREEGELPLLSGQVVESLLVTRKDVINKRLVELDLQQSYGCTVSRIRRSGIVISPSPELTLKYGDKVVVVGDKTGVDALARYFGNDQKKLSDTDFFPIAMGIVLGVLFGQISISLPGFEFSPGLTGGVLIMALILSAKGKTGPIIWTMSGPANQLLRQLGLLLFLAEVGTSAGVGLVATFQQSGILLFIVGAIITILPMIVATVVGRWIFKINMLDMLGTLTGSMTSTPGLAAADSMADSNVPSIAYATVYPIAMVVLIVAIQLIAKLVI